MPGSLRESDGRAHRRPAQRGDEEAAATGVHAKDYNAASQPRASPGDAKPRAPPPVPDFTSLVAPLGGDIRLCAFRARTTDIASFEIDGDDDEDEPTLASPVTGPDRAVYSHELRGALDDAVASLPAWLHSVFCMRIVDEVPYPDVCQRFKISPVNARQRIQQARRHLRSRLSRFT